MPPFAGPFCRAAGARFTAQPGMDSNRLEKQLINIQHMIYELRRYKRELICCVNFAHLFFLCHIMPYPFIGYL